MNFLERLLGYAVDGGDGSIEALLLAAPLLLGVWYLALKASRRSRARRLPG